MIPPIYLRITGLVHEAGDIIAISRYGWNCGWQDPTIASKVRCRRTRRVKDYEQFVSEKTVE